MAKFKIGDPKPINSGRKPGVKNKTTQEIRDAIQKVLADKVDELADDLAMMPEFKQWTILSAVAKYVMPTLAKNDNDTTLSGEIKYNVNINFVDAHNDPTGDNEDAES
ncbi:hypothetical protein [Mucilaginibacter ginsenosidivorax]|uniref:DUF5681 domain-containing protein n=1 Tax=Mucilaginibacter ginsenosidivorax TaxID=862126 RepID=A0A5B8W754_9SPHI|nr:hypothetical protein [Mucilaginibacter ginsenosidivorax]QEC78756.1 hypothetical protein FSB76_23430 [Mucilaginibacter ginsenosidivorax]